MPWTQAFLDQLEAPSWRPLLKLKFLDLPESVGSTVQFGSHPSNSLQYGIVGFTSFGGSVVPSPCQVVNGGFEVVVEGNLRGLLDDLPIGSMAEVWMGFPGWADSAWQCVDRGQLQSISRAAGLKERFTLRFGDVISAMQTRLTTDTGTVGDPDDSQAPLFWRINESGRTYSSGGFTPGVTTQLTAQGGLSPGTNNFDQFGQESGQNSMLKITTQSGAVFYLEWTNKASSTVINLAGTGGQRGTTSQAFAAFSAGPPPSGAILAPVALLRGHPATILRKILTSTGSGSGGVGGTGGIYDLYPASWGIDPNSVAQSWLNNADIDEWTQEVLVTDVGSYTNYSWELIAEEKVENGLSWWHQYALAAGIWACQRQGEIVVRALQDLNASTTRQYYGLKETGLEITDDDIIEFLGFEAVDPSQQAVSRLTQVLASDDTYTGSDSYSGDYNRRLPALPSTDHDLTAVLFPAAGLPLGTSEGDCKRLLCWDALPWETWSVRVRLKFAQVCKGDVLRFTTSKVYGSLKETRYGYSSQPCMVMGVGRVNWLPPDPPSVELKLVFLTVP